MKKILSPLVVAGVVGTYVIALLLTLNVTVFKSPHLVNSPVDFFYKLLIAPLFSMWISMFGVVIGIALSLSLGLFYSLVQFFLKLGFLPDILFAALIAVPIQILFLKISDQNAALDLFNSENLYLLFAIFLGGVAAAYVFRRLVGLDTFLRLTNSKPHLPSRGS